MGPPRESAKLPQILEKCCQVGSSVGNRYVTSIELAHVPSASRQDV